MKIKKLLVWILVFALLNLVITPNFALAKSDWTPEPPPPQIDIDNNPDWTPIIIGGAVLLGVLVIYLIVKAAKPKSTTESQPSNTVFEQAQLSNIQTNDNDQLLTSSGNVVILKW